VEGRRSSNTPLARTPPQGIRDPCPLAYLVRGTSVDPSPARWFIASLHDSSPARATAARSCLPARRVATRGDMFAVRRARSREDALAASTRSFDRRDQLLIEQRAFRLRPRAAPSPNGTSKASRLTNHARDPSCGSTTSLDPHPRDHERRAAVDVIGVGDTSSSRRHPCATHS
jgi:hypothetical protein